MAAKLACDEGFLYSDLNALANCVIGIIHVEAQTAKFLLRLQSFKLASGCLLKFGDQRLLPEALRELQSDRCVVAAFYCSKYPVNPACHLFTLRCRSGIARGILGNCRVRLPVF